MHYKNCNNSNKSKITSAFSSLSQPTDDDKFMIISLCTLWGDKLRRTENDKKKYFLESGREKIKCVGRERKFNRFKCV